MSVPESAMAQEPWSLTAQQRRDFLIYYSPALMLRAEEAGNPGRSWISNFDYDGDNQYLNNRDNWVSDLSDYIADPSTGSWSIRPTLYTFLIEFMETDGSKSLVLVYHVYHPFDDPSFQPRDRIHDWERIEMRINNVTGDPGSGEEVAFVVATTHYDHVAKLAGDGDLNFQITPTGKHVMIWQAQYDQGARNAGGHELRFVQDSFSVIDQHVSANDVARVETTGGATRKNIHYVYVCEAASGATDYWNAQRLTDSNAASLTSGDDSSHTTYWNRVVRVGYELQDIADIVPTHLSTSPQVSNHWTDGTTVDVFFDSPIVNDYGVPQVNTGLHTFNVGGGDGRKGYLSKSWMWGVFDWNGTSSQRIIEDAFEGDPPEPNRALASGLPQSLGNWWYQHDYFAHDGGDSEMPESGRWLPRSWQTDLAGGWDGRWQVLFRQDGTDTRPPPPDPPNPPTGCLESSTGGGLMLFGLLILGRKRRSRS